MGTARTRASNKYSAKTYDRIALQVKKGRRDELKAIAESCGESLNTFINKAIEKRIERERIAPNAETIGAIEEVEEMIQTGTGEHFEGETAVFFDSILEG